MPLIARKTPRKETSCVSHMTWVSRMDIALRQGEAVTLEALWQQDSRSSKKKRSLLKKHNSYSNAVLRRWFMRADCDVEQTLRFALRHNLLPTVWEERLELAGDFLDYSQLKSISSLRLAGVIWWTVQRLVKPEINLLDAPFFRSGASLTSGITHSQSRTFVLMKPWVERTVSKTLEARYAALMCVLPTPTAAPLIRARF